MTRSVDTELCKVHHLRELTYVFEDEELGQAWAGCLMDLLLAAACHEINDASSHLPTQRIADFLNRYPEIRVAGEAVNFLTPRSDKRRRTRPIQAVNVLVPLRTYADDVWRFDTDHHVPVTNNLAEKSVRLPMSRSHAENLRRLQNQERFRRLLHRPFLLCHHVQAGDNPYRAYTQTFQHQSPQPCFA